MHKALFDRVFRQSFLLCCLSFILTFTTQVLAQATDPDVHLSLCIDASGSVEQAGFDTQIDGTADAIENVVPTDGTVEISVIIFGTVGTPLTFTESDNGNLMTNSIVVNSAADIADIASEIRGAVYPQPGQGTNTQDCVNEAMDLLGCGTVEGAFQACPEDVIQVIDISTDGDPTLTSLSSTACVNNGSTVDPECNNDVIAASNEARDRGVDVINVIGIGPGPTVSNMQSWAFDAITTPPPAPRPAASTVEVFDPLNSQPGNMYTEDNPAYGSRGYVVLAGTFEEYQPTIDAKITSEIFPPDLSVVKSAATTVAPGTNDFTYTLVISNNGLADVTDIVITDTLPEGVIYDSVETNLLNGATATCSNSGGMPDVVTCEIASIAAGTTSGSTDVNVFIVVDVN